MSYFATFRSRWLGGTTTPEEKKTGDSLAFSEAGRLLIKNEPTILGEGRTAKATPS
jgi:hypothetical protein